MFAQLNSATFFLSASDFYVFQQTDFYYATIEFVEMFDLSVIVKHLLSLSSTDATKKHQVEFESEQTK